MSETYTHKYIYKTAREDNLFLEEYYSGTDTKVFFDDDRQTQISYINYSLDEQLKPIYGYASRTFDDLVVGARIVTGTFKVPIQNIEEQSTDEEVMEDKSTMEEIEESNAIQDKNIKDTAWTNNPTKEPSNPNKTVPDDLVNALKDEGYDVDTNSSEDDKKKAVNDYKKKNNIRVELPDESVLKRLIQEKFMANANVNATNIFMSPGGSNIAYTIPVGETLKIEVLSGPYNSVTGDNKQYTLIRYKDQSGKTKTGYVESSFVEELQ